jgi:exosortase H (IPTLxxWG-CTERM-specific)
MSRRKTNRSQSKQPKQPKQRMAGVAQPSRKAGWLEEKGPMVRFTLKFGAILAGFYAISFLPPCQTIVDGYLQVTAWVANGLLHLIGERSSLTGASIWSQASSVTVTEACSALEFTWFLAAAILAFPGPWLRKLAGVGLGFVVLSALNVLRVASLYLIGVHSVGAFTVVHEDAWPALLILATLLLMATWITWSRRPASLENHAAA